MLEVEKKSQPTEDQLDSLLEGAKFINKEKIYDIYYDYPDFRLLKKGVYFRKRNGSFELKIKLDSMNADSEIKDEEEIRRYFDVVEDLEEFIKKDLDISIEYEFEREKWEKKGFVIDIDEINLGEKNIKICEIELLVKNEDEVKEANKKIKEFAKECDIKIEKISKKAEYLQFVRPDLYNEIYGKKSFKEDEKKEIEKTEKEKRELKKEMPTFEIKMK